jgi:hypothetical protein
MAQPRRDWNAEARIQAAIVEWIRWVAPQVVVYAIPNGGLRTKAEAARLKWTGVLAGMPDLGIVAPPNGSAFFLEIKPPGGSLSADQKEIIPRLISVGAPSRVARSVEDARAAFEFWGIETREARERAAG